MSALEVHDSPSQGVMCEDCHRAGRVTVTVAGHNIQTRRLRPDRRAFFCRRCAKKLEAVWDSALEYEATTGNGMSVT